MSKKDSNIITSERRIDIDIAKGIGIILVIMGHSALPLWVRNTIYIFHMPLFFFISGLLYKTNITSIKEYTLKKAKSLLYPYFILGVLIILYNTSFDIITHSFNALKLLKRIIALLYGGYIWENNSEYIGVLWFLVALYIVEILFHLILQKSRSTKILILYTTIIILFGFLLSYFINLSRKITYNGAGIRLPFCADIALLGFGFFVIGYLVQNVNLSHFLACLSFIGGILLGWVNIKLFGISVDMLYLRINNPVLFFSSAVLCSYGLCECCRLISISCKKGNIIRFITTCGKNSLLMMVIHMYLSFYISKLLDFVKFGYEPVIVVFTIVFTYYISIFVSKYMKWVYKKN